MPKKEEDKDTPLPFKETWWKHFLAGGVSGCVSRTLTAPVDRLKVLAQVHGKTFNLVSGIRGLVKSDGLSALWRGNFINMIKITPEFATKFMVYEMMKLKMMALKDGDLTMLDRFVAAGIAGVASQTVIYPVEVLKTRLVIETGMKSPGVVKLTRDMLAKVGYYGLVRGYPSAMAGIIVYTGTDLCVYETVKLFLVKELGLTGMIPPTVTVTCAVASCITGQFVAFPLSMASTFVQVTDDLKVTARSEILKRYREYGLKGLYRGATMAYLKAGPAVIITYLVYEHMLWELGAKMS